MRNPLSIESTEKKFKKKKNNDLDERNLYRMKAHGEHVKVLRPFQQHSYGFNDSTGDLRHLPGQRLIYDPQNPIRM
jgi:hypothetical protein